MKPTEEQLANLARLVNATADNEIDCAEVLDRVADYLSAIKEHAPRTAYLQQVAQHLKVCPECHEEFALLIKAEGLDPHTLFAD